MTGILTRSNLLSVMVLIATIKTKVELFLISVEKYFYMCIPSQDFYCCHKTPWSKATQGGKSSFHLTASTSLSWEDRTGTLGRNLEVGTDAEPTEEYCLLACSSWISQLAFLQHSGLPGQRWQPSQWHGPSHINKENAPKACS